LEKKLSVEILTTALAGTTDPAAQHRAKKV
jgi:hypothetical protein